MNLERSEGGVYGRLASREAIVGGPAAPAVAVRDIEKAQACEHAVAEKGLWWGACQGGGGVLARTGRSGGRTLARAPSRRSVRGGVSKRDRFFDKLERRAPTSGTIVMSAFPWQRNDC